MIKELNVNIEKVEKAYVVEVATNYYLLVVQLASDKDIDEARRDGTIIDMSLKLARNCDNILDIEEIPILFITKDANKAINNIERSYKSVSLCNIDIKVSNVYFTCGSAFCNNCIGRSTNHWVTDKLINNVLFIIKLYMKDKDNDTSR